MRAVGIKVLKNRLSDYVRAAAGGETILVTDHDRVVAELRPPAVGRVETVDDQELLDLVREGVLTPALRRTGEAPPSLPRLPLAELLGQLDEDRADRR